MQGKILVVHRNELILDVIRDMLQDLGYVVTQAKDGHRALGKALSTHFNLIIVNHALNGGLTGSQLVERMKKYGVRTPIIGTAPQAIWEDPIGFDNGTVDYLLPSPFDYAELIKAVETLTRTRPFEPAIDTPAEPDAFAEPELLEWQPEPDIFETLSNENPPPVPSASLAPQAEPISQPSQHMPSVEPRQSGIPHVLLVETDREQCKQIEAHLQRAGFAVSIFHNGREAYEDMMFNDYELILTDLWLPGMDGFEMIDALRKSGVDAPIAVFTAHITREMVQELIAYRICKILLKPIKPSDLLTLVQAQAI